VIRDLTHQPRFRLDDPLHVAAHAFGIVVALAVDHDAMRHAFDVKSYRLEVARFEG